MDKLDAKSGMWDCVSPLPHGHQACSCLGVTLSKSRPPSLSLVGALSHTLTPSAPD